MPQPSEPISRGALLLSTGGALIVAALIVFGAILPAEFNRDPTGLGKLTGISRLWAPDQVEIGNQGGATAGPSAREFGAPLRNDVIEIPLGSSDRGGGPYQLEYKVAMKKGAVFVYEWEVVGLSNPNEFYYDFHGHTVPKNPDQKIVVSTHKQDVGLRMSGVLTAPFDGIQGWLFQNQGVDPVRVRVRLSGFYELVPPGQPGNEFGIQANQPADVVRKGMLSPQAER